MSRTSTWLSRLGVFLVLAVLALPAAAQLKVVASFSILADLVQEVGGQQVTVAALVGSEQDAHTYQVRPSDLARLQQADLVVINGLGFEGWLERAVRGSGYQGPVVVATSGVPVLAGGHVHEHEHDHEHDHGYEAEPHQSHDHGHQRGDEHPSHSHHVQASRQTHTQPSKSAHQHDSAEPLDPHAWQDPRRVLQYVDNIARALGEQDPLNAAIYQKRATDYQRRLQALDAEVAALLQPLVASGVRVITPHASFAYLADRYGVEFVALQGANAAGEAKAGELARLIRELQADPKVVLFTETVNVPPVLRQLAAETGLGLQGRLYSDMLSGPAGPASNYLNLLRHNAELLAQSVQPQP